MVRLLLFLATICIASFFSNAVSAYKNSNNSMQAGCDRRSQFTFSWSFKDSCALKPRGGSTQGAKVELSGKPYDAWLGLKVKGLSKFEKDRQAILAMAGPYRTSFDFLETVGYVPGFEPDAPYQSWGTEYIYIIENKKHFISLQHIMVMFFEFDGKSHGPMVMKHWRQDWQYEKKQNLNYVGHQRFRLESIPRAKSKGSWSQAVFQVDDSPRYESFGYWEHKSNFSTWISQTTRRPLPRREHSVRQDYHVLEGFNRHTIVPTGWVQEEENYKLVLNEKGMPLGETPYLSKELGVNRYERISNHDFSAGDDYWLATSPFWSELREQWSKLIAKKKTFMLKKNVDGKPLFEILFAYADDIKNKSRAFDALAAKQFIEKSLAQYVQ